MNFTLTPEFSGLVFKKVGQMAQEELDLSSEIGQQAFAKGFVDSLQKEGSLSPDQAFGVISFFCQQGSDWIDQSGIDIEKTAAFEWLNDAKNKIVDFGGNLIKPFTDNAANKTIGGYLDKAKDMATEYGTKAWDYLKSPDFLKGIAPLLIGGVAGALLPRLFSKDPGVLPTIAGAGGGALMGKLLSNNSEEIMEHGRDYIDKIRKAYSDFWRKEP